MFLKLLKNMFFSIGILFIPPAIGFLFFDKTGEFVGMILSLIYALIRFKIILKDTNTDKVS